MLEIAEEIKAIRGPGGKMSTVDKSLRQTKERLLFLCGETQMTQVKKLSVPR